uniref:Uncharacterized protein MANES_09G123800 n=1 Tax=Rhizophora mucronata TaxID=61149 RepID=A0A2P2KEH5_RHIMU
MQSIYYILVFPSSHQLHLFVGGTFEHPTCYRMLVFRRNLPQLLVLLLIIVGKTVPWRVYWPMFKG